MLICQRVLAASASYLIITKQSKIHASHDGNGNVQLRAFQAVKLPHGELSAMPKR